MNEIELLKLLSELALKDELSDEDFILYKDLKIKFQEK